MYSFIPGDVTSLDYARNEQDGRLYQNDYFEEEGKYRLTSRY